jgi:hypothetical protein
MEESIINTTSEENINAVEKLGILVYNDILVILLKYLDLKDIIGRIILINK